MMGLGAMVGTSVYVLLGGAALVGGAAVGWAILLNGGLVLLTAVAYVELGSVLPRAGGGYAWAKEGLRPPLGFLAGVLTWGGALTAVAVSALGLAAFGGDVLRGNGICLLLALPVHDPARFTAPPPTGLGGLILAMGVTFVAFEGYEVIAGASEEVRDPRRTLSRAVVIAVVFVTTVDRKSTRLNSSHGYIPSA